MDPTAAEESFLDEVLEANLSEEKVLPTLARSREPPPDIKVPPGDPFPTAPLHDCPCGCS